MRKAGAFNRQIRATGLADTGDSINGHTSMFETRSKKDDLNGLEKRVRRLLCSAYELSLSLVDYSARKCYIVLFGLIGSTNYVIRQPTFGILTLR